MHDVIGINLNYDIICVNLYRTKSLLNPQKNGVTGALSTTLVSYEERAGGFGLNRNDEIF